MVKRVNIQVSRVGVHDQRVVHHVFCLKKMGMCIKWVAAAAMRFQQQKVRDSQLIIPQKREKWTKWTIEISDFPHKTSIHFGDFPAIGCGRTVVSGACP